MKLNSKKVYKNNKINEANFVNLNLNDYQVFLHLLTKFYIDTQHNLESQNNIPKDHEYILTVKEFSKEFSIDSSNCYKILSNACRKLMKTSITLDRLDFKEVWEINICSSARYQAENSQIKIKFTNDIIPYLLQVKQKFTLYNLKEVSNFGSLYTTRLYELISSFKYTGWLQKTVNDLRNILGVPISRLKLYGHFKNRAIQHAVNEINLNHHLNLKFEEIKEGKKVIAIKFLFEKTMSR